jgi:hypothetical protein
MPILKMALGSVLAQYIPALAGGALLEETYKLNRTPAITIKPARMNHAAVLGDFMA